MEYPSALMVKLSRNSERYQPKKVTDHSKLSNRPEGTRDQKPGPVQENWAKLTPSKVGSDVYPIFSDCSEESLTVSPEILDPIDVIDSLINWHFRLIHYREPILGHAVNSVSAPAEGSQETGTY